MRAALLLILAGCATIPSGTTSSTAGQCPSDSLVVDNAKCDATVSADYGLTAKSPLEWGDAAQGIGLWKGRLVCPGGATAFAERNGSIGAVRSSSPRAAGSAKPDESAPDILDEWAVRCGGKVAAQFITDMYRCGNPCPPKGFKIMDARILPLRSAVKAALDAKRFDVAVERATEAQKIEPDLELTNSWLGIALYVAQRCGDAIAPLELAAKLNPANWSTATYLMDCYENTDKRGQYFDLLEDMLVRFKEEKKLHGELLCRKAAVLQGLGRVVEANTLASQACAEGEKGCCAEER